jgi:hypothetical protein
VTASCTEDEWEGEDPEDEKAEAEGIVDATVCWSKISHIVILSPESTKVRFVSARSMVQDGWCSAMALSTLASSSEANVKARVSRCAGEDRKEIFRI